MRAICVFCCAMICFALTPIAFSQEFAGGWELRVKQHPSDDFPYIALEVLVWSDAVCESGDVFLAQGGFIIDASAPIIHEGYGVIRVDCKIGFLNPMGIWIPYCQHGIAANPPMARGTRIADFNFIQILFGGEILYPVFYDVPLHVMDIILPITDLTPRDLILRTGASRLGFSCDDHGVATPVSPITTIIEHQIIVRVNGGTCRADLDGDGQLTLFDFLEFQNLFAMGDLRADFDGDGELTFFDFLAFQNEFALGCE